MRISLTPVPTLVIGFQSEGSKPRCTASSSKPAWRRASAGKSRISSRLDPMNRKHFIGRLYKFIDKLSRDFDNLVKEWSSRRLLNALHDNKEVTDLLSQKMGQAVLSAKLILSQG